MKTKSLGSLELQLMYSISGTWLLRDAVKVRFRRRDLTCGTNALAVNVLHIQIGANDDSATFTDAYGSVPQLCNPLKSIAAVASTAASQPQCDICSSQPCLNVKYSSGVFYIQNDQMVEVIYNVAGSLCVQRYGCDQYATCTVSGEAMSCVCLPGFTGNGTTCVDIDECLDPTTCNANKGYGNCTNTIDGGGWTLMSADHGNGMAGKTYKEYIDGFGTPSYQQVWLGLDLLNGMTNYENTSMRLSQLFNTSY
ncbi:hypothetical protein RB195_011325 [Necator americanus]|uniref:EGF-like domain-containing protein n=1 Tax=Necator americanus TaxID=51031 RepID=A0ABR1D219_NECAM